MFCITRKYCTITIERMMIAPTKRTMYVRRRFDIPASAQVARGVAEQADSDAKQRVQG